MANKYFWHFFLIFNLAIFSFTDARAADAIKTAEAEITLIPVAMRADEADWLLDIKLARDWHTYWRDPGDVGLALSLLRANDAENIKSLTINWPFPKRRIDNMGGQNYLSHIYENRVLFPLTVKQKQENFDAKLSFAIQMSVCHNICIPISGILTRSMTANYVASEQIRADFANAMAAVPREILLFEADLNVWREENANGEVIALLISGKEKNVQEIFLEKENSAAEIGFYAPQKNAEKWRFPLITPQKYSNNFPRIRASLQSDNGELFTTIIPPDAWQILEKKSSGLENNSENAPLKMGRFFLLMLISAFLGGVILNAMPCVLPVLSMKLLHVLKHSGASRKNIGRAFFASALGIWLAFIFLGFLVAALRQAGISVGWGFHFQSPIFVMGLGVILLFFALALLDWVDLILPNWLVQKLAVQGEKETSFIGHMASGVLATALATPCTAPLVGSAVAFAFSQPLLPLLLILFTMGLGLSAPYVLVAIYPQAISWLPKPGKWMLYFKTIMGAGLLLTALWLLWILRQQISPIALGIWCSLLVIVAALLRLRLLRFSAIILFVILLGFAFALVNSTNHFSRNSAAVEKNAWQDFEESLLEKHVADGKIVFVDITADWCLTCLFNKQTVLNRNPVSSLLKSPRIITMRGDWTDQNEDIRKFLTKNQRQGIPFNIVYGPNAPQGILLSELLSAEEIENALHKAGL